MQRLLFIIAAILFPVVILAQESDSSRHVIKRQWKLSEDYSEEVEVAIDTAFSLFHHYKSAEKSSPFIIYPGNYGQPVYQLDFFDRPTDPVQYLYRHYLPFMHVPTNALFMNTQIPYTELVFNYAGPRDRADQSFRIRHSQNVNRKLNFGLIYDIVYNLGQYNYQRTSDKAFAFHSSYTGDRYNMYFQAGLNKLYTYENGGIVDPVQMETFDTRDLETKLGGLSKAVNLLSNTNFLLVQKYYVSNSAIPVSDSTTSGNDRRRFRMTGTFSHIFEYSKTSRSYTDNYPESGFYDTNYVNTDITFDTLSFRSMRNTVRFDFSTDETRKFKLGGGFGLRNEIQRYYQVVIPYDYPLADNTVRHRSSNVIIGRLFNNIGARFGWRADGEFYLTGYRAGDFNFRGVLTKSFSGKKGDAVWNITAGLSNIQPSSWMESWSGNNFRWNDDLQKEFRITAGTDLSVPGWNTYLRAGYALIDNYAYFGSMAIPEQHTGGLSVLSVLLRKEFVLWKFHLSADVLMQQSSNEDVLDLPLVAVKSAAFFQHNIHFKITNGNLNTQFGVEVMYNTDYHGYAYMPATGVYYNQNRTSNGSYPYLNAFLNVKLKRTRIFLMLDHFNSGMSGYNYFLVPDNPMNIRTFRYGLAWTFYD
ncbi:MAG: putative porin [Bacteroidales bacterium]